MTDCIRLVHTSINEMRCSFSTMAIRRKAISEKYAGGLPAFLEKYLAQSNRHLVVICEMSGAYLEEPGEDIMKNGLEPKKDFVCFSAMTILYSNETGRKILKQIGFDKPFYVEGSDWLKGYYTDHGMNIWYVDN